MKTSIYLQIALAFLLSLSTPTKALTSINTGHTVTQVRTAVKNGSSYIIAGTYEGGIMSISYDGTIAWHNELSGFMNNDLWCSDLDKDGKDEILTANADGHIYCLNSEGKLLWSFSKNSAGMMSVCTVKDGASTYIACGGFDKSIYYLNTNGEEIMEIASSSYSNLKPWGDGNRPDNYVHTTGFLRPVNHSDGTQSLALQGTHNHMQSKGNIYLFKPLENLPYQENAVSLGNTSVNKAMVGDLRALDSDGDGNDQLYFGSSGYRGDIASSMYLPAEDSFIQHLIPQGDLEFGYRVLQTDYIPTTTGYEYIFCFGDRIYIADQDYSEDNVTQLQSNYSYWDMRVDHSRDILVLASSQSGGSCIHILDVTTDNWMSDYENLVPPGKINDIINNTNNYKASLENFTPPSWERTPLPVYFMSEGLSTTITQQVVSDITANYDSPIFLGNKYTSNKEDWDRDGVPNTTYYEKRDSRMNYIWSAEECLDYVKTTSNDAGIAFWGGHGNDPYMFQQSTLRSILDYGDQNDNTTVLTYPELGDHSSEFGEVLDHHFFPLADYAQDKQGKLFIRSKNIFWLSACHMPMWEQLANGEYADVFVPSMEETTDKVMELSLTARLGLWASGSVNSWGARSVPDNVSMNRSRQFSHQKLPNHALRQMVYSISSGAQYLDNLTSDDDYMSFLWELIAKGALYVPERDEILSFSPVHLSMLSPDDEFLEEGSNVKWTTFYDEAHDNTNPMVFSRMKGHWPGAPVTEWDFSRYAAGIKDRHFHFIPPYNNGMVLLTTPQSEYLLDETNPKNKLIDNLHPFYKNIMSEYITDGRYYYSPDTSQTYPANTYYTTIEQDIKNKANLLPVTVKGEVGWVVAQTAPNHLRLTLVDGGYINPSDKTATIHFNGITAVKISDILDQNTYNVQGDSTIIDVKCGLFRFIDIELSEDFDEDNFPTGISNNSPQTHTLSVNPNPFTNEILIKSNQNIVQLDLFDISGKQVFSADNVNRIDTESLEPGLHILQILTDDGEIHHEKVIKK